MAADWQNIIVVLLVAAAVAHLAWRGWRLFFAAGKRSGCGSSCGGCPTSAARPLATIDLGPPRRGANR